MNFAATYLENVEESRSEIMLTILLWEMNVIRTAPAEKCSQMPFGVINHVMMTKGLRTDQTKANRFHKGPVGSLVADELKAIVANSALLLPYVTDVKDCPIEQQLVKQTSNLLECNIVVHGRFFHGCPFEPYVFH
jgi:hypothetical protein